MSLIEPEGGPDYDQNQWYAVLSSHMLKLGGLIGARRFGENLVFFRNSRGEAGCVMDLCAHRGAALSGGCVSGDHIRCPFHGQSDGQL